MEIGRKGMMSDTKGWKWMDGMEWKDNFKRSNRIEKKIDVGRKGKEGN